MPIVTKTTKAKKKPKKRGPKEQRLIITEDPAAALARLLKQTRAKPRTQA